MKKSIALLALAFGVTGAYAQDLTSKKGEPILPEADDWSIGIDATPFLNYAGNFIGGNGLNSAPSFTYFTNNFSISGKMMKDAQTAYRANVRIGMGNTTTRNMVASRMNTAPSGTATGYPAQLAQVENKWKHSSTNVGLAVGMEKRRGKTRLQGLYGAEVGLSISSTKDKFTYGNTLATEKTPTGPNEATNVTPDNNDAFSGANNVVTASSLSLSGANTAGVGGTAMARALERKSGMTLTFGVRAFIGAEYFVMPKMSIGGEFGWGIGLRTTGAGKTTWESTGSNDGTTDTVGSTEIKGAKGMSFSLDTDNNSMFAPSGVLKFNLYF